MDDIISLGEHIWSVINVLCCCVYQKHMSLITSITSHVTGGAAASAQAPACETQAMQTSPQQKPP